MEQLSGVTSSRGRRVHGASTNKRAADSRALALASTIRTLRAEGFVAQREMADELNRRGIPTVFGASWHRTTIARMLTRLGIANRNIGRTSKRVADVRAEAVGPTIRKLRNAGFVSITAIARELNKRQVSAPRGGKWHPGSVRRLLLRLQRLEASLRTPNEGDEPK